MNIMQCQGVLQGARRRRKLGENEFDYIYGITTTGKEWRYIIYTSENKIYKGIPQWIELSREKLSLDDYKEKLKGSIETTVKTIAWMLDSQANPKTTSKRQHLDALAKPEVDTEEE